MSLCAIINVKSKIVLSGMLLLLQSLTTDLFVSECRGVSYSLSDSLQICFLTLVFTQQCTVWIDVSIFHHQSNHTKSFVSLVNNPMAICFCITHILVLIPLSLTSYLTSEPVRPFLLDSTFIGFCSIDCQVFDRSVDVSSQCTTIEFLFLFHWSIPFDGWLSCTCDLMIVSVDGLKQVWGQCPLLGQKVIWELETACHLYW